MVNANYIPTRKLPPIYSTALRPDDPDDGPAGRQMRGMAIAARVPIRRHGMGYRVPSQSGRGTYFVTLEGGDPFCSCPDFELTNRPCKHIHAVELIIIRDELPDEPAPPAPPEPPPLANPRPNPYGRNWAAYTAAQEHEGELFPKLLRELCDTIPQPPQGNGRPRMLLSDMIFGAGLKVFSTMSGRRAMSDLRDAHAEGLMDRMPNFATVLRYLGKPEMTPLLIGLIQQSATPLAGVETNFAIDSTGFATSTYHRWFDHKWGREIAEAEWVKVHLMCGVTTNIVTDAGAANGYASADAPYLRPFVETTARNFQVDEVSGDKAYLSRDNLRAVAEVGGTAYIPFKRNSVAHSGHHRRDRLWERAYHFFQLHRDEFLEHYHRRSNVETTMDMIKAKFGASVRAKTETAQVNEALTKVLCHNIVVLIKAMYELGITPEFAGAEEAEGGLVRLR